MTEKGNEETVEQLYSQKPIVEILDRLVDTLKYLTQIHAMLPYVKDVKDVEKHYSLLVKPEVERLVKDLDDLPPIPKLFAEGDKS